MKSFLDGKKSLATPSLATAPRVLAQHVPVAQKGHLHEAPAQKGNLAHQGAKANVEIVKEGDKIVRIFVTCTCGERVEIECLYPAGS